MWGVLKTNVNSMNKNISILYTIERRKNGSDLGGKVD
jgi:hypothetical protein